MSGDLVSRSLRLQHPDVYFLLVILAQAVARTVVPRPERGARAHFPQSPCVRGARP